MTSFFKSVSLYEVIPNGEGTRWLYFMPQSQLHCFREHSKMIYLLRVLCSLVTVFLSCQLEFLSQHFFPQSLASSRKEAREHSLEDAGSTDCSSVLGTYSRDLSSAWSDCVNPYPVWASLITLPLWAFQWVPAGFFRSLWSTPCFVLPLAQTLCML